MMTVGSCPSSTAIGTQHALDGPEGCSQSKTGGALTKWKRY